MTQAREESEEKITVGEEKEATSSELQDESLDRNEGDEVYDELESKKLVRKLDLRIMPLAIWSYLLAYLDRSNIGNAKVLDKETGDDLLTVTGTSNYQYTIALMLFFVAYIIFEVPSNFCLKKLGPSKWIAIICLLWGVLTCCLGAISNFSSLAAVRFLLGAAEAGLFPGLVTCMALFYRPEERSLRVALILASATLAGAFGSALATGIAQLNGVHGIEAFRYIFICEGLPSIATAPLIWFFFPDSPESASFLTEAEKDLSRRRLIGASTLRSDDKLTWKDTLMILKDFRLYLHYLAYIGISAPFSSISLFQPTIVSGLGYSSGVKANLFSVPPFAAAWVVTCLTAFLADRYNRRGVASAIASLFAATMFAILGGLPDGHYTARYVVLILANSGAFASIPPLLGWLSANSRNTTAAAITIPINVSFGGIGQIIGVWIYKADEAPKYPTGQFTNFAFLLMTSILCVVLEFIYLSRNREIERKEREGDANEVAVDEKVRVKERAQRWAY